MKGPLEVAATAIGTMSASIMSRMESTLLGLVYWRKSWPGVLLDNVVVVVSLAALLRGLLCPCWPSF